MTQLKHDREQLASSLKSRSARGKPGDNADEVDEGQMPAVAESGGDDAEPGTKVEPLKAPDANSVDWEDGDEAVRPEQVTVTADAPVDPPADATADAPYEPVAGQPA